MDMLQSELCNSKLFVEFEEETSIKSEVKLNFEIFYPLLHKYSARVASLREDSKKTDKFGTLS